MFWGINVLSALYPAKRRAAKRTAFRSFRQKNFTGAAGGSHDFSNSFRFRSIISLISLM